MRSESSGRSVAVNYKSRFVGRYKMDYCLVEARLAIQRGPMHLDAHGCPGGSGQIEVAPAVHAAGVQARESEKLEAILVVVVFDGVFDAGCGR